MEKIYGYKSQDVALLAEYLKEKGNITLTEAFRRFGAEHGKAQGTVRNLYYALAKKSATDSEFCAKYLNGKPINVGKIVEFDDSDQEKLIFDVLSLVKQGMSVRGAIARITDGNAKLMLRYQNKYRNVMKKHPELIEKAAAQLGFNYSPLKKAKDGDFSVSTDNLRYLKSQINALVARISDKVRAENQILKSRVISLEKENSRLINLLLDKKPDAAAFFKAREHADSLPN